MDPDERRMLTELSELDGVSDATIVRQLIRRTYGERLGRLPAAAAKTKPKPK
jgi:hypothetical protein